MIQSDNQIEALCTLPTFVITELVADENPRVREFTAQNNFVHMTLAEVETLPKANTKDHRVNKDQRIVNASMGLVSYRELTEDEKEAYPLMIAPYSNQQHRFDDNGNKIISWGQSSFGYDVRLAGEFKIFSNLNSIAIDPLNFDDKCLHDHKGPFCIIPPNSYILGKTIEYFNIPRDVQVVCVGKSTYARAGAIVNVTPIEPGFKGNVVIEVSNSTPLPLKVYANMGISQFLFFKGSEPCKVSYADRDGKYQGQTSIVTPLG